MKKLYIWGAGDIGSRILNHLDDNWDIVFVDSNKSLIDKRYCEKRVINIEEYLQNCFNEFILIAHLYELESIKTLQNKNIINFFVHCDLPGEFKEPCFGNTLKDYVIAYLNNRRNYALYGLNLYSIIIDDWIYKEYGHHPYIIIQNDISEEFVDKIKRQYRDLKLIKDDKTISGLDEVCVCLHNYTELKKSNMFAKYQMTDIFDCTDRIEHYHNPAIKKFYNLHDGKRCFIVATGPSIRASDLDILKNKNEICISMNSIHHVFSQTDWRPDYYVISDFRVFDEYQDILNALPKEDKFLSDNSESFWKIPHKNNVFRYHLHYEYCFDRLPKFSDDFSMRNYTGTTVTYTCMQLAAYMGFKEIYLLGVDFTYGGQEKNIEYNYFYKTDDSEDKCRGFVKHVTLAYKAAKQYADSHGIYIYNATRGGKLEIFPRADFDSLF
ncbi:MAG: DUF115 domain-containing protein [Lachnospiraceae bacterium]|jgi:hypothetical protein|nr:DUF115 domain-containing protein [Lachnospiraceae bacterium]